MLFNTSRKYDFMLRITLDWVSKLEVVEEMKLLGIVLQTNINLAGKYSKYVQKWLQQTLDIEKFKKIWSWNPRFTGCLHKAM